MSALQFVSSPPKNGKKPKAMIMLLHGYGSNAQDLISLVPDLSGYLRDAVFISPNAPFQFEGGMSGAYQWYSLVDRSSAAMLANYEQARPVLEEFIEEQLDAHSLARNRLVLMGFSQGGMMALHYGSESEKELMGVVSFSGFLLDEGQFAENVRSKPRTLITHGDLDMVVPIEAYKYALNKLKTLKFPVKGYQARGLGHGIDYGCLEAAQEFLRGL